MSSPQENILSYMLNFLEKPHPVFSNMPPCPYARKERVENKIQYFETTITTQGPSSSLLEEIRTFHSSPQWTTMLAYASIQEVDVQECYNFAQQITDALIDIDILAIPLHPEDPFEVQGVRTRQVPYVMMLIQRRAVLAAAKEKLLNTKYYANWDDKDFKIIANIHEKLGKKGVFFPLFWWTDEVLKQVQQGAPFPEIVITSTVNILSRNEMHLWMHKWGRTFGWRPLCNFYKWKQIRDLGASTTLIATAHGGGEDGFTAILYPQEELSSEIPSAYPMQESWATKWVGGSYIWIYDPTILRDSLVGSTPIMQTAS